MTAAENDKKHWMETKILLRPLLQWHVHVCPTPCRRLVIAATTLVLMGGQAVWAIDIQALDPLGTANEMWATDLAQNNCTLEPLVSPVTLLEAVKHSLCHNPKTQEALVDVKVKAAQMGSAKAAYLPTLSATLRTAKDNATSNVRSAPALDEKNHMGYHDYTLTLSWKLMDFGARSGQLEYARQLLAAAQDAQDDTLQAVFMTTVKDYYQTIAEQSGLAAAMQTEEDARQSLDGAKARYKLGVAAIIDQMQAQTTYAMAVLDRSKAASDLKLSLGKLALDMGQSPNMSISVPENLAEPLVDQSLDVAIDELIDQVKRSHPKVLQAQAQLAGAIAKARSVRGEGMPTLSFNAKLDRNNQPVIPSIGLAPLSAGSTDHYVGLQLDVPLFEGFDRTYQIRNAQAVVQGQQAALFEAQEQVALDVWNSYATLQKDTENLHNTQILLESAQQTHIAAEQRYQKGAGSILELLTTQSVLATARQKRVQSLMDWQTAKLQLAASLGHLSSAALKYLN